MQSVLCYAIHFDAIRDKNYLNAKGNPSTAPYGFTRELRVQIEMVVCTCTDTKRPYYLHTNKPNAYKTDNYRHTAQFMEKFQFQPSYFD